MIDGSESILISIQKVILIPYLCGSFRIKWSRWRKNVFRRKSIRRWKWSLMDFVKSNRMESFGMVSSSITLPQFPSTCFFTPFSIDLFIDYWINNHEKWIRIEKFLSLGLQFVAFYCAFTAHWFQLSDIRFISRDTIIIVNLNPT